LDGASGSYGHFLLTRTSLINTFKREEVAPGAKAHVLAGFGGTAEAVPFPKLFMRIVLMFRWTSSCNHEIVKHYDAKELLSQ
jgi:hypothetical protein